VSQTGPLFVPSDGALADLRLLLRGVPLPLEVLGETLPEEPIPAFAASAARDQADAGTPVARLRLPAELGDQVERDGALMIADEEGKPVATLTDVSVSRSADGDLLARGHVAAVDPAAWSPLVAPRAGVGPVTVLLATRPLLFADIEQVRARADREVLVVAVPISAPTPDGLPAATLLRLVQTALRQGGSEPPVHVVPVELAWRDPATDAALALAVARSLGAPAVTPMADGEQDWSRLLAALDGDTPLPRVAADDVLRELRRWRPPPSRRGVVVLFTGLSGAGKSTLARALHAHLLATTDRTVSLLDGDAVRRLLSAGLGFDRASRDLNVRRIGFVAAEVSRHGGIAICAPIAPYAESRAAVRAMAREVGDFLLVHVSTPLAEAERRDVKGLYARARAGLIETFTGISDPYDEPIDADVTLDTSVLSVDEALERLVGHMHRHGWLTSGTREG
jgi:sulfate adenylyltransferase